MDFGCHTGKPGDGLTRVRTEEGVTLGSTTTTTTGTVRDAAAAIAESARTFRGARAD